MASQNGLGPLKIRALPGAIPTATLDVNFFPSISKSWAISFMVNDQAAPTGRPAGSLSWAGLANSFFWIDMTNRIGGFWSTQLFPFMHPTAVSEYLNFEGSVYNHLYPRA